MRVLALENKATDSKLKIIPFYNYIQRGREDQGRR